MALQTIADTVLPPGAGAGGALAGTLIGTYVGHVLGYLPAIVAVIGGVFAIVWYMIMIYESNTFKTWREERAEHIKARKIARLSAKQKIIAAELETLTSKGGNNAHP